MEMGDGGDPMTSTIAHPNITSERRQFGIGPIGGPTVVIDYGSTRFLTDPTFSEPGTWGVMTKLEPPAIPPASLGSVDVVLLSHQDHKDNLDDEGRVVAEQAGQIITNPTSATAFGRNVRATPAGSSVAIARADGKGEILVTAVPATHGPIDGDRDEQGRVNTEVTGFVLTSAGLPTVYVSGDNASILPIIDIRKNFPDIDVAVLFMGAARNPLKSRSRALTLTGDRAADVTLLLGVTTVIPAHFRGWSIYSESELEIVMAFDDAGIRDRLTIAPPGTWSI